MITRTTWFMVQLTGIIMMASGSLIAILAPFYTTSVSILVFGGLLLTTIGYAKEGEEETMKQPTIEFHVETDTCPRCGGHSFERVWIRERNIWQTTYRNIEVWKCLSCKQVIDEVK